MVRRLVRNRRRRARRGAGVARGRARGCLYELGGRRDLVGRQRSAPFRGGVPVDPLSLLWLFFILASLEPAVQRQLLAARRRQNLFTLSRKRKATVIMLIHRQETVSVLGIPVARCLAGTTHAFVFGGTRQISMIASPRRSRDLQPAPPRPESPWH
ncbi:MAG: SDH family Clp fold serine proteinase [Gaiellaceae bacterium]